MSAVEIWTPEIQISFEQYQRTRENRYYNTVKKVIDKYYEISFTTYIHIFDNDIYAEGLNIVNYQILTHLDNIIPNNAKNYIFMLVRNNVWEYSRKLQKSKKHNENTENIEKYYNNDINDNNDILINENPDLETESVFQKENIRAEILSALEEKLQSIISINPPINSNLEAYIQEFRQYLIDNDFSLLDWENYICTKLQIDHTKFTILNRKAGFNNRLFLNLLEDEEINDNDSDLKKYVLTKQPAIYLNHDWNINNDNEFKTSGNFPTTYCLILGLITKPQKKGLIQFTQKGKDFLTNKIKLPKTILVNENQEIVKQSRILYSINDILYDDDITHDETILYIIQNKEDNKVKIKRNTKVQRQDIFTGEIKIYQTPKIAALENNLKYRWIFKFIKTKEVYLNFVYSYYLKDDIVYNYESQEINKKPDRKMKKDENGKKYYYQVQRKNVLTNEIIIYETVKIAAEKNNIDIKKLYRRLNIRSVVNDYEFSYVLENNQKKYLNNNEAKVYKISIDKMKIIEVYPNVMETARLNNLKYSTLLHRIEDQIIKDGVLYSKSMPEEIILKDKMLQNHNIIKKIDIRTNEVLKEFHFLHEAAKDAGLKTINALNARIKKKVVIDNILYTRD